MSETSQGDGWWMASDGKWYPPESRSHLPAPPKPPNVVDPRVAAFVSADEDAKPAGLSDMNGTQWAGVGAAIAIAIGAMLSWATARTGFGQLSKSGLEGDGVVTLLLGVVGAISIARARSRGIWGATVSGGIVAAIGIINYADVTKIEGIDVGGGLFLTIIGGVVLFAAGLQIWDTRRRADPIDPAAGNPKPLPPSPPEPDANAE